MYLREECGFNHPNSGGSTEYGPRHIEGRAQGR